MSHACVRTFDVTNTVEIFLRTKQSLRSERTCTLNNNSTVTTSYDACMYHVLCNSDELLLCCFYADPTLF